MRISAIYARDLQGAIGFEGKMPWHIPEDLEFFKTKTRGSNLVMGWKTWDSLPVGKLNTLDRCRIVLSTNEDTVNRIYSEGADVLVHNLPLFIANMLEKHPELDDFYIIGGGETIASTLDICDYVYETVVSLKLGRYDSVVPTDLHNRGFIKAMTGPRRKSVSGEYFQTNTWKKA